MYNVGTFPKKNKLSTASIIFVCVGGGGGGGVSNPFCLSSSLPVAPPFFPIILSVSTRGGSGLNFSGSGQAWVRLGLYPFPDFKIENWP
jgi:hypothetical protein